MTTRIATTPMRYATSYFTLSPIARRAFGRIMRSIGWKTDRGTWYDPKNDRGRYLEIHGVDRNGHLRFDGCPPQELLDLLPCSIGGVHAKPIAGSPVMVGFDGCYRANVDQATDGVVVQDCRTPGDPSIRTIQVPATFAGSDRFHDCRYSGRMDVVLEPRPGLEHGATHLAVAMHQGWYLSHMDGRVRYDDEDEMPF